MVSVRVFFCAKTDGRKKNPFLFFFPTLLRGSSKRNDHLQTDALSAAGKIFFAAIISPGGGEGGEGTVANDRTFLVEEVVASLPPSSLLKFLFATTSYFAGAHFRPVSVTKSSRGKGRTWREKREEEKQWRKKRGNEIRVH